MLFEKPLLVAVNSRYTHSNPAVYCLKSYLHSRGLAVEAVEFNINGQLLDMLAEIVRRQPDVVGFSCYIWNIRMIETLTEMLKKVLPKCRVLWGGPQMNGLAEHWFAKHPQLDFIIEGEGEVAWQGLLECNGDWAAAPGLWWKQYVPASEAGGSDSEQGFQLIHNEHAGYVNLSEIPFYYSDEDLQNLSKRIIYYESSRGCPFGCKFCLSSREPVRYRDLSLVKADLQKLLECGCKKIKLVDRTFNSDRKRAADILRFLLSIYRKGVCFHLELEPLCLSRELVDILLQAPAGYFQAEIGVQSLYEPALRAVGRKNLATDAIELIGRLIAAENIHIHLDLIGGLPYETLDEFKNSFDALYEIFPHYLQLGFLKILPGTPLAEQAADYDMAYVDEPPYQVLQTPWLPYADMRQLAVTEHAVDDYYNEMFFEETLRSAVSGWQKAGGRPFDFFYDLGAADLAVDGGKNQNQKAQILFDFLCQHFPQQRQLWLSTLTLDFVRGRMQPPDFILQPEAMDILKGSYEALVALLPDLAVLPRRKWLKRYQVFSLNQSVGHYLPGMYAADLENLHGIWQRPQIILLKA